MGLHTEECRRQREEGQQLPPLHVLGAEREPGRSRGLGDFSSPARGEVVFLRLSRRAKNLEERKHRILCFHPSCDAFCAVDVKSNVREQFSVSHKSPRLFVSMWLLLSGARYLLALPQAKFARKFANTQVVTRHQRATTKHHFFLLSSLLLCPTVFQDFFVSLCARVCARACLRACVRACVRASGRPNRIVWK